MKALSAAIFLAMSCFQNLPLIAAPNFPILRNFDFKICEAVLEKLAEAHRDVIVRDGITLRGTVAEIDPFDAARRRLTEHGAPVTAVDSPESLANFQRSLHEMLSSLETTDDPAADIDAFRARWGVSEAQMTGILLPYREYDPRFSEVLQRIIPDEEAQNLATWAKFRTFLDNAPRLRARLDFYLANIGQLSIPQMVEVLRREDPNVHEGRVRSEISALHLQIQASFDQVVPPGRLDALNHLLTGHGRKAHGQPPPSFLEAIQFALAQGENVDDISRALEIGTQATRFFLHFKKIQLKAVAWDRPVIDASGERVTEETLLRRLHAAGLYYHDIAAELNAAHGRMIGNYPLPSDDNFRTLGGVKGKVKTLGLREKHNFGPDDHVDPEFGVVKEGGELALPGALELIRARRAAGDSDHTIAKKLTVSLSGMRNFETMHSEDFETGLPSPLNRLLRDPEIAREARIKPAKAPPVGTDKLFDPFDNSFREGAKDWIITTATAFTRELALLRKHLGLDEDAGKTMLGVTAKGWGGVAKQNEEATNFETKKVEIRNVRYRLYSILKNAIALHNAKYPTGVRLEPNQLKTSQGIKFVIETLRGDKLGKPYEVGKDPIFDQFESHFRGATDDWAMASARHWEREAQMIQKTLGLTPEQWIEKMGTLKNGNRLSARLDEGKQAHDPLRITGIRAARREFYTYLKKGLELYNAKFPEAPLDTNLLGSEEGIKTVIETLRGEKFGEAHDKGRDIAFDHFSDSFRTATDTWSLAGATAWPKNVAKIKAHLQMNETDWTEQFGDVKKSWGTTARQQESENPAARFARYQLFGFLKKAIEAHNLKYPGGPRLDKSQLETPDGIVQVANILTSAPP